jgi:hypothetical protein
MEPVEMTDVREHGEEYAVELAEKNSRLVVKAYNEGGYNFTTVDLLDLIAWLKANRPNLLVESVA